MERRARTSTLPLRSARRISPSPELVLVFARSDSTNMWVNHTSKRPGCNDAAASAVRSSRGGPHPWSPGYPGATRVPPRLAAYQRRGWHCPRSGTRGLIKPCQVGVGAAETTRPRCVPVRGLLRSDCAGCCSHPGGILGGRTCRGPARGGTRPPPRLCATRLRHPGLAPPSCAGWPGPARHPAPHGAQRGTQAAGWKA